MTCTHCRKQIVRARVVAGSYFCNERCAHMHVWAELGDAVRANYGWSIIAGFDFAHIDNVVERSIYYTGTASNPWPKEKP